MRPYGFDYTNNDSPKPTRRRFTNPQAFYDLYEEFRLRDAEDAERRSRIRRIYNGNLPYDPKDLEAAGQAWRTNMNFQQMSEVIDARALAVNKLAVENCNLVSLYSNTPESAGPDDTRIASVVSEEFSRMVRKDGRSIPALAMMNKEADLYGIGSVTWRDPDDYVPVALERGQVYFDPEGSSCSADHEVIMIETTLRADYLFQVLDNPNIAAKAGWNIPAVKRWVVAAFHPDQDTRSSAMSTGGIPAIEAAVEDMRRSDFYETHQFGTMSVIFAYVREMKAPRKISFIIAPATRQYCSYGDGPVKEFLFTQENAYDSMNDVFVWYVPKGCVRYAKSQRGIASRLAPVTALNDRLTCALVDSTVRAMSLVVKQKNPGASPMLSLHELGPYTVVGADLDPVPNGNQMSNFQGVLQVRGLIDAIGAHSVAGTTLSGAVPAVHEGGAQPSKAEAEIFERRRIQRDENDYANRMSAWDTIMEVMFSRVVDIIKQGGAVLSSYPDVERFVKRCERRGVSVSVLKKVRDNFTVEVCRDLVVGSDGIVQFLGGIVNTLGGNADEAGRRAMSHDIVRQRLGIAAANRYFPIESRDNSPSNDMSIATLENNALQNLMPAVVAPDQRHLSHMLTHMQVLQQIQQTVQQGLVDAQRKVETEGVDSVTRNKDGEYAPQIEDPERLAQVLQSVSQHIQQHLAFFRPQLGAEAKAKEIQKMITGLAPTIKALNLAIDEQRRVREGQEEKRQRELEELQKRADQAEYDKATHEMDLRAENERRRIELDHQIALERLRMEGETGRARLALASEESRDRSRIAFEAARNDAILKTEQSRGAMALRDQEARQNLDLNRASAEQEALLRAGESAAKRMESSDRVAAVTGRGSPQPSDVMNNADSGVIPL